MASVNQGMKLLAITAVTIGAVAGVPVAQAAVDGPKVNWAWASFGNARPGTTIMDKMVEIVGAETNGNFTIKIAYGETLAPSKEIIDGIKIGAFEGGFWTPPFAPGKMPASSIFTLPFLPVGNFESATRISDVYYRHPVVKKDFDAWSSTYVAPILIPSYEFIGRGEAPVTLADWKGKRVRALGGQGQAMAKLGAVATTVTSPEVYGAMEKGVIDAAALPYYAFVSYKLQEIAKWYTKDFGLGYVISNVAVGTAAVDKLPPQYKKVLFDAVAPSLAAHNKALREDDEKSVEQFRARGLKEIVISPSMQTELVKIGGQPVWDEWVKDITSKGYPGQELLDVILNEAKKSNS